MKTSWTIHGLAFLALAATAPASMAQFPTMPSAPQPKTMSYTREAPKSTPKRQYTPMLESPAAPVTQRVGYVTDDDITNPPLACQAGCCTTPSCQPHVSIYGDYLYLTAKDSIAFAQVVDGEGPNAVPMGQVGIVDSDASSGFRVGGSVLLERRVKLNLGFTWFENSTEAELRVPNGQPFLIRALTVFPTTANTADDSLAADANATVRFVFGDLNFEYELCQAECSRLSVSLGARYAHLDQEFLGRYLLDGVTTVATDIRFNGAGPRVGFDGSYDVWTHGFLFARGAASFLFGRYNADYRQENVFRLLEAQAELKDDRFVTILDFETGFGVKFKGVSFQTGYTIAGWLNTMTSASWIDQVQTGGFVDGNGNQQNGFNTSRQDGTESLIFHGLFARVQFEF